MVRWTKKVTPQEDETKVTTTHTGRRERSPFAERGLLLSGESALGRERRAGLNAGESPLPAAGHKVGEAPREPEQRHHPKTANAEESPNSANTDTAGRALGDATGEKEVRAKYGLLLAFLFFSRRRELRVPV